MLRTRLERLDRLESWLKSDDPLILRDAAQELGVSLRTIHRDLELLRDRGVPVESDRGRGGGVRVAASWGVGRITLTRAEAIDLLVGLAIGEVVHGALQLSHAAPIRRKILGSFSKADQRRIAAMRARIRVGGMASAPVFDSLGALNQQVGDEIKEAFVFNRQLHMRYRDGAGVQTERLVDLHFLLLNPPVWYALCWDHSRGAMRTFRCDRISGAQVETTGFKPRPWSDFADTMARNPTHPV